MQSYLYLIATAISPTAISPGNLPQAETNTSEISKILSIVFGIIGALAFLMLTISGLRYVLSGGDPDKISKAKNGIVGALVGLLVALTAQAIVAFVVANI